MLLLSNTMKKTEEIVKFLNQLTKAYLHFMEIAVFSIIISRLFACESEIYGLK